MKLKKLMQLMSIVVSVTLITPTLYYAADIADETETTSEVEATEEVTTETTVETEAETTKTTETTETTETEVITEKNTESQTESESEKSTESESETKKGTDDEVRNIVKGDDSDEETDDGEETDDIEGNELEGQEDSKYDSNESLVNAQQIVIPPSIEQSYQFVQVKKIYALSKKNKVKIYEEMDTDSKKVGRLDKNAICYILDEDSEWYYVESGTVRGFVKADKLITGDDAEEYIAEKEEENLETAKVIVDPLENEALTYTKTTVYDVLAEKVYALANGDNVNIRDEKSEESEVVGKLAENALCYILEDTEDDEWVFVESGNVRGFIKKEFLNTGKSVDKEVEENEESSYETASQEVEPEDNKAFYYTLMSTKEANVSNIIRESITSFASQFLGNAYVWGGTSLTNGADCSGFVQSLYAEYGYTLPRVAEDQAQYGTKIPVEEALPGDLIFYAKEGYIYHVVMYIGDGKTIEAQSSNTGIVNANVNYSNAVWATRIISDEDSDVIDMISSREGDTFYTQVSEDQIGDYLGNFKLTAYCSCSICCGIWSGGPTASGNTPLEGRTVAMAGVPFGTKLIINGYVYTVDDRGTPYGHVDIYMNSHEQAQQFGAQSADVYLAK